MDATYYQQGKTIAETIVAQCRSEKTSLLAGIEDGSIARTYRTDRRLLALQVVLEASDHSEDMLKNLLVAGRDVGWGKHGTELHHTATGAHYRYSVSKQLEGAALHEDTFEALVDAAHRHLAVVLPPLNETIAEDPTGRLLGMIGQMVDTTLIHTGNIKIHSTGQQSRSR